VKEKKKLSLIEILGGGTLLFGCFLKSRIGNRILPESFGWIFQYSNLFFWAGLLLCAYLWFLRD